jgi:hypothetical protein
MVEIKGVALVAGQPESIQAMPVSSIKGGLTV